MIKKLLLALILLIIFIAPANAEIPTVDHIQPPELLYLSIIGLFFLLGLIIWDAKSRYVESRRFLKLEYFLKVTMGGLSMFLAFLVSTWFSGRGIIWPVYSGLTYDVQSQSLSIFFLVWGLLMVVYTFGSIMLYFEEANRTIEKGFENDRRTALR